MAGRYPVNQHSCQVKTWYINLPNTVIAVLLYHVFLACVWTISTCWDCSPCVIVHTLKGLVLQHTYTTTAKRLLFLSFFPVILRLLMTLQEIHSCDTCGCCRRVESDDAEACNVRLQPRHWGGVCTCVFDHTPVQTCSSAKKHTHSWTEHRSLRVWTSTDVIFNGWKESMKCFWRGGVISDPRREVKDQWHRWANSVLEKSLCIPHIDSSSLPALRICSTYWKSNHRLKALLFNKLSPVIFPVCLVLIRSMCF